MLITVIALAGSLSLVHASKFANLLFRLLFLCSGVYFCQYIFGVNIALRG